MIELKRMMLQFVFSRKHSDMHEVDDLANKVINSQGIKSVGYDGFQFNNVDFSRLKFEYYCQDDDKSTFDDDGDLLDSVGEWVIIKVTDDRYDDGFEAYRGMI